MFKTKMFFYLLITFAAYGLVGRIDYEEAVRVENGYKHAVALQGASMSSAGLPQEQHDARVTGVALAERFADPCLAQRH